MEKIKGFTLSALLCMFLVLSGNAQDFEGSIDMRVVSDELDHTTHLLVKGHKTSMEIIIDSLETIRILKDKKEQTSIVLKQKKDLKFGFESPEHLANHVEYRNNDRLSDDIKMEISDEEKLINQYKSQKIFFDAPSASGEVWITKDLVYKLSTFFPQFLSENLEQDLLDVRKAMEKIGFVLEYTEYNFEQEKEVKVIISIEQKELSERVFKYGPDYQVLNRDKLRQLMLEAQSDERKKRQLDGFLELFGS